MTRAVTLKPYFRACGDSGPAIGPEQYVAGFEDSGGEPWGQAVPLEPDEVESTVLSAMTFSVSMEPNGTLLVEVDGRGDAANEAIANSGHRARRPLDTVVRDVLDPELLSMEDDALEVLTMLRDRLADALRLVEDAICKEDERQG